MAGIDPIMLGIINAKIRALEISSAGGLTSTIVSSLPATGENNKIYIITEEEDGVTISKMHMYIEGMWHLVGTSELDSKDWLHVYTVETMADFYNIFKKNTLSAPVYFDAAGAVTYEITNHQVANTIRSSGLIYKAPDGNYILDFTSGNGASKYTVTATINPTASTLTIVKMNCFKAMNVHYNSATETVIITNDYSGT